MYKKDLLLFGRLQIRVRHSLSPVWFVCSFGYRKTYVFYLPFDDPVICYVCFPSLWFSLLYISSNVPMILTSSKTRCYSERERQRPLSNRKLCPLCGDSNVSIAVKCMEEWNFQTNASHHPTSISNSKIYSRITWNILSMLKWIIIKCEEEKVVKCEFQIKLIPLDYRVRDIKNR